MSHLAQLLLLLHLPLARRVVLRYFQACPAPHAYISGASHGPGAGDLAAASLRALQLLPDIRSHWGCGPFLALLQHTVSSRRLPGPS